METIPHPLIALVVDDNPDNRRICEIALHAAGYGVKEAENGKQAIAMLDTDSYHLVILDLAMPGINGMQVLRHLRQGTRNPETTVVITTANPHMAETVDAEADYIMQKPLSILEFTQLTKRLGQMRLRPEG